MDGGEGRNGKTGITALHCPAANPSSISHKKTFDTSQCLSPTLPVTPTHSGLHKLNTTRRNTFTRLQIQSVSSLCPLCFSDSMKSALHRRLGALFCYSPAFPSSPLSSILHGSALLRGPIRPLCRSMACGQPGSKVIQSAPCSLMQGFQGTYEGKYSNPTSPDFSFFLTECSFLCG